MAIKIVPGEVRATFRAMLIKYATTSGIVLFVALVMGYYATYSFIYGNFGNTIIFGLLSLGFMMVATSVVIYKIADHEAKMAHAPDQVQFWRDIEAAEAGLITIDQLMQKHALDIIRLIKIFSDWTSKHTKIPAPNIFNNTSAGTSRVEPGTADPTTNVSALQKVVDLVNNRS